MEAVEADQAEEGGEEAADLGRDSAAREVDELEQFEPDEDQAEQAGDQQEDLGPEQVAGIGRGEGEAAGVAREQEGRGLPADPRHLDQLAYSRPARGRAPLNREGGEEAGEHDYVGEQEDPEAVADDDPLARRAGHSVAGALDRALLPVAAMAEPVRVLAHPADGLDGGGERMVGHAGTLPSAAIRSSRASRWARRARSTRATSSAGTWNSWTLRQAKTTKPAKAAARPSPASHQICQMSAKPVTLANTAV